MTCGSFNINLNQCYSLSLFRFIQNRLKERALKFKNLIIIFISHFNLITFTFVVSIIDVVASKAD